MTSKTFPIQIQNTFANNNMKEEKLYIMFKNLFPKHFGFNILTPCNNWYSKSVLIGSLVMAG